MNINKQRILAILIVFVICFSIIPPINVHAATTTTDAPANIEWTKSTVNGDVYQISYYHPVGYDKFVMGAANNKCFVIYFNSENSSIGTDPRTGTGDFIIFSIGEGTGWPGITATDRVNICRDLLYNDESTERAVTSNQVRYRQIIYFNSTSDESFYGGYYTQTTYEQHPALTHESYKNCEIIYEEWYLAKYGFYPPLATTTPDENVSFMQGNYYAILSQESIIKDGNEGYVDTVEKINMTSNIVSEIDGEKRGLLYVVISSENTNGDLIGHGTLAKDSIWEWFLSVVAKAEIWTGIGDMQRNNYNLTQGYIFYNSKAKLNRYYFSNIQDACKFVLYGTAGAEPIYEEIGKTDYGYGYISCEYNNYGITGFPLKSVPMEQYPLGRQEIILAQHDVQGEGKKFVYIDLNYYSRVSMLDSEMNLIINNEYMQPEYFVYTQGAEILENAKDKTLYEPDETYKIKRSTTFPIYNSKTTDPTGTWDVVYSTYDYFQIKEGQILDGDEHPPILQIGADNKGNKVVYNTDTNTVYKNGETDPYIYNPDTGKYYNSKGEELDLGDYTFATLEWQNTIKDYKDNIEGLAGLIEDFTGFINSSTKQIEEITGLLNAVMLSLPGIFKTLILMSFIALICGRVIKRKGN